MEHDVARTLLPRATARRAGLASATLAALSTGTPLVLAALSDRLVAVAQAHDRSGSWMLLGATLVLVVVCLLLSVLVQARAERRRQDVLVDAQTTATKRMLSLARTTPAGTIKERLVDDLTDVVTMRVQTLPELAVSAVVALISLVWVARISPWALAWAVLGSLATILPAWAVKQWAERAYEDTTDVEAAIDALVGSAPLRTFRLSKNYRSPAEVFDLAARVVPDPVTGSPLVVPVRPLRSRERADAATDAGEGQ